jgi:GxxExxY protein
MTDSNLTSRIIGAAIAVHRELGPGLLEAVYEECLCYELELAGLQLERQKPIRVIYRSNNLDGGYRADIVVCGCVIIEVKAIAAVALIHQAVMLKYLRLSGCHLDFLTNFHSAILKDGVHRYVWNCHPAVRESKRRDAEVAEE